MKRGKRDAGGGWVGGLLAEYLGLMAVVVVLVLVFGQLGRHFLSVANLATIANNLPELIVVAVGMTVVLIIGGIDLSVGSVLALSAAVFGVAVAQWEWPWWTAGVAAVGVGAACGAVTGGVTVLAKVPSFIVSLGMLEVARGLAYIVTDTRTLYLGSRVGPLGVRVGGGVSVAFLAALAIVALAQLLLSRTVFGRQCFAIGTNEQAVRLSGIAPGPRRWLVFVFSGTLAAVGGLFQAARLASVNPNNAVGLELDAIAAVVIGGTSLMGGRGSATRTLLGVLIIAVLQAGLSAVGTSDAAKRVITGGVIVLAVVLDALRQRYASQLWERVTAARNV